MTVVRFAVDRERSVRRGQSCESNCDSNIFSDFLFGRLGGANAGKRTGIFLKASVTYCSEPEKLLVSEFFLRGTAMEYIPSPDVHKTPRPPVTSRSSVSLHLFLAYLPKRIPFCGLLLFHLLADSARKQT